MGAAFLFAICPIPRYSDDHPTPAVLTDAVAEALNERARALTKDQAESTCEGVHGESLTQRMEELGMEDAYGEIINDLLHSIKELRVDSRERGTLFLDGRTYWLTGGMSWSDDPTTAFAGLRLLEFSGITEEPLDVANPDANR
jgi:hypothetical protein